METDCDKYAEGLAAAKTSAEARGLYFYVYKGCLYIEDGEDTVARKASEEESIMFSMLV